MYIFKELREYITIQLKRGKMMDFHEQGRFYLEQQKQRIAEIDFMHPSGKAYYVITHTGVDESLKGQGVGKELVKRVVDKARADGLKILPLCPYAKSQFEKTPAYADVWYQKG